jgi:hypothetical protein
MVNKLFNLRREFSIQVSFAKQKEWPNQISVTYQADVPNLELQDNGIEIGQSTNSF